MDTYQGLSHHQLMCLLDKHDQQKKLGPVWKRKELEADRALEAEFVALDLLPSKSDRQQTPRGGRTLCV